MLYLTITINIDFLDQICPNRIIDFIISPEHDLEFKFRDSSTFILEKFLAQISKYFVKESKTGFNPLLAQQFLPINGCGHKFSIVNGS
jgi:hypothetical protein